VATLTIRDLDDDLKARLRIRAAEHGRSMEAEVRELLRQVLAPRPAGQGLGTRIHRRFAALDVDGLDLPPRDEAPRAADLHR
jgi:plasmid stability protein